MPSASADSSAKASAKAEPRGGEGAATGAGGGTRPPDESEPGPADEAPGVPGFRTWRGVYWFVFACFAAIVLALTLFARVFA